MITGAENMLDFQRRDIQAFTGAILTDQYGCSEGCGNASQCPEFVYHEDFEFGVLEGVEQKREIRRSRFSARDSPAMSSPSFVMKWGTRGVAARRSACACGRRSRVLLRIEGRTDDYVITPEGARIMRFDYVFKDALNVKEVQIVQERLAR